MKGSEAKMTGFMEGADKRYIIPVYQRKYDWKLENCRQLYSDLKKIVLEGRSSHFLAALFLLWFQSEAGSNTILSTVSSALQRSRYCFWPCEI